MSAKETTGFADKHGREIFLGDVVRAAVEDPFTKTHGAWAEYEITKAAGGYVLSYFRSETGSILPFGYTAQFMNQFAVDDLPDLKMLLWSKSPVEHPSIELVVSGYSPEERRELFMVESRTMRAAKGGAA